MIGYMQEGIREAMGQLRSAVDSLLAAGLDSLSDAELTDVVRDLEAASRRLAPVEHRLTAEVERRGIAQARGCRDTEASAQAKAADRCASRSSLSGELLAPLLPVVAAGQAAGEISPRHAAIVGDTIDKLPDSVDEAGEVAGWEASRSSRGG